MEAAPIPEEEEQEQEPGGEEEESPNRKGTSPPQVGGYVWLQACVNVLDAGFRILGIRVG